jgi:hypothetical protein
MTKKWAVIRNRVRKGSVNTPIYLPVFFLGDRFMLSDKVAEKVFAGYARESIDLKWA